MKGMVMNGPIPTMSIIQRDPAPEADISAKFSQGLPVTGCRLLDYDCAPCAQNTFC
jgi:hypothetical protein